MLKLMPMAISVTGNSVEEVAGAMAAVAAGDSG